MGTDEEKRAAFEKLFPRRPEEVKPVTGTLFGERLRELRLARGFKQSVVARNIACSIGYLSMLENGQRGNPSPALVDQICVLFGLIWDEAEDLKELARQSRTRVAIETADLGPEATRAVNLMADVLPRIDEGEAGQMADFLAERKKKL